MLPFHILLFLIFCVGGSAFADQGLDVSATTFQVGFAEPFSPEIPVYDLQVRIDGEHAVLSWSQAQLTHPDNGTYLAGYRVFFGENPHRLNLLAETPRTHYRHRRAVRAVRGFYRVTAVYGDAARRQRQARHIRRDNVVLLDFDADLDLLPYSEEDIDTAGWEMTDEEGLPDSEGSLHLFGNTWKRLAIDEIEVTDSTVWTIGILSVDGDTLADLQGFGLSDGEQQLFYTFHGMRTVWEHPWAIAYQDVNQRGDWHVYGMPIGYDWNVRYEYLPTITELYFINDNDDNDPASDLYFDELIDITESIQPAPVPVIHWRRITRRMYPPVMGLGEPVSFTSLIENREPEGLTFFWESGDGATSDQQDFVHYYQWDGIYTAALTVTDENGIVGQTVAEIEVGDLPNKPATLTACFTGDIMLARRYEDNGGIIDRFGPESVFNRIQPRLLEFDLSMINLECLLTDEGRRHPTKSITFRGRPANVAGLTYAGFDFATLGNNHVQDYGERGLEETLEVLDAAGIVHTGAGMNEYQALQPAFKSVRGIRVGALAYCNRTGRDYGSRPFGDAAYDRYGFAYFSGDNLVRSVPDAAEQCDILVVYVHGGTEYAIQPDAVGFNEQFPAWHDERIKFDVERDSATIELEHLAIDLGADLIIGGHPHVLQGFEIYEGVVIAHSMGNFAFDQNFFETWPSMLVCTELGRDGVEDLWIEPVFIDNYRPTPAVGTLGRKIIDRLAGYSNDLSALFVPDYERSQARIVLDFDRVAMRVSEHRVTGRMRYFEEDSVYRSEPLRLNDGGFPSRIVRIDPPLDDGEWSLSLGREIMLVGNMEHEGALIWNYNSNSEGADEDEVHNGRFSSQLTRQAGWQDGITDLTQRIPVSAVEDRLTLCGWLRTVNAVDAGIAARYYRYRYDNDPDNILGEQVAERRLQGDNDWTYLWDQMILSEETEFLNVRWQLFGAEIGQNQIWADDLELIRWEELMQFEAALDIDNPNDLFYLQLETEVEVEEVEVIYRTMTYEFEEE